MIARSLAPRLHYAWVVAGVTFLVLVCSAGFRSAPSVMIVPLQHEFGWDRATISVAVSINLVLFGLSGPFAAALMLRFGIKQIMVCALALIAVAAACSSAVRTPWELYLLWGVAVGIGTGAMASVLSTMIAGRWFVQRRGVVLGLLSAAFATGQIQFLPLLAYLVTLSGWRAAAFAVSGVALALIPIVVILMANSPKDVGLRAYGAPPGVDPAPVTGNPLANALRGLRLGSQSRTFWLLAGSFFICGASTNGLIGTHLIPAAMDRGISEIAAAGMLATMGIFDIIGTTFSGWLTDRWNPRRLLAWYYVLRGLSLLLLPYALGAPGLALIIFVVFYGLDWVATVPPTAALATETFGQENLGIVYGWIFTAHQFGAASAAYGAGFIRTSTGQYLPAFLIAGALCMLAAGFVLRIPRLSLPTIAPLRPAETEVAAAP